MNNTSCDREREIRIDVSVEPPSASKRGVVESRGDMERREGRCCLGCLGVWLCWGVMVGSLFLWRWWYVAVPLFLCGVYGLLRSWGCFTRNYDSDGVSPFDDGWPF